MGFRWRRVTGDRSRSYVYFLLAFPSIVNRVRRWYWVKSSSKPILNRLYSCWLDDVSRPLAEFVYIIVFQSRFPWYQQRYQHD